MRACTRPSPAHGTPGPLGRRGPALRAAQTWIRENAHARGRSDRFVGLLNNQMLSIQGTAASGRPMVIAGAMGGRTTGKEPPMSSSTMEVGRRLVELCRQGKAKEAIDALYSPDIVSIEAQSVGGRP